MRVREKERRDQDWEEEEGKERTRRKQTRHNQEVTMMRERKRLNGKDPFRVPPGVGLRAHSRQIVAVVGGSEELGLSEIMAGL